MLTAVTGVREISTGPGNIQARTNADDNSMLTLSLKKNKYVLPSGLVDRKTRDTKLSVIPPKPPVKPPVHASR